MKLKKLFALALAVCMMVSVMPTSFAGNGFLSLDGVQPAAITTGPSLTLDTPGTVSGGSVTTPSVSQSSQSVYTPYVYSNPYGVSSVADEVEEEDPFDGNLSDGDAGTNAASAAMLWENTPDTTDPTRTSAKGLVTTKNVTKKAGTENTYTVTLESYLKTIPCDIVFVVDQSSSMGREYPKDDEGHWVYTSNPWSRTYIPIVGYSYNPSFGLFALFGGSTGEYYVKINNAEGEHGQDNNPDNFALLTRRWSGFKGINDMFTYYYTGLDGTEKSITTGSITDSTVYYTRAWSEVDTSTKTGSLKTAVQSAVTAIANNAAVNGLDHRVAFVGFSSDYGYDINGDGNFANYSVSGQEIKEVFGYDKTAWFNGTSWIDYSANLENNGTSDALLNATNSAAITNAINGLAVGEYDAADHKLGLTMANNILKNSTDRQKVVIMLTDSVVGFEAEHSDKHAKREQETIAYAKTMQGNTAIFAINMSDQAAVDTFVKQLVPANTTSTTYYYNETNEENLVDAGGSIVADIVELTIPQTEADHAVDYVSQYFTIVDGTVNAYTIPYAGKDAQGNETFAGETEIPLLTISGKRVSASFNYKANICKKTADGVSGKKLVMTFDIKPEEGFMGGNDVPTNGTNSGVYLESALVEHFDYPRVDIPVAAVQVAATDKNVYLTNGLTDEQLAYGATVSIGGTPVVLTEGLGLAAADQWKADYLTSIQLTVNRDWEFANEDGKFSVTATVTGGDANSNGNSSKDANIFVFKPNLTFKDTTIYWGKTANYKNNNVGSVEWLHRTASGTILGEEPAVKITYVTEAAAFDGCTDVAVDKVLLGKLNADGKVEYSDEDYAADTTFWKKPEEGDAYENNESHQFTVHVVKPTIQYADTTIYLGDTVTFIDQVAEADMWECDSSCEARRSLNVMKNETERLAPTIHYDYGDASTQPGGCTEVTVTATIGTGDNMKTVTAADQATGFWIHVLKPTVTFQDSEIFLSEEADYAADNVVEPAKDQQATWDCQCVENKGSTNEDPPELTYTYQPEADFFETCQPVDVTVFAKFTSDVNITSGVTFKNGSEDRTASEEKFKVHVYRPNIVLTSQPLWNNYDATADYAKLAQGVKTVAIDKWIDQCGAKAEKETNSTNIGVSEPKYTFTLGETDITKTGYMAKTYDTTDKDTITATLAGIKVGAGTYDVAKQLPAVAPVNFDIHVNKFELTIKTDWTNSDGEEQGSIFTVTPVDREDENLKPITVAIPKGVNSVVITGLFSGQEYTIAEDNGWTWRYGTAAEAVGGPNIVCNEEFDTDEPDKEAEVTMSFDDGGTYNAKWLADEDCVVNKATTQATTISPTLSVKKKDEEVTGA